MKKRSIFSLYETLPVLVFVFIIVLFIVATNGSILSGISMSSMFQRMAYTMIGACGMIFVVSMGSIDMTMGALVGVSSILAAMASQAVGGWAFIPVSLLSGIFVGLFTGVIVAKAKVSSFMTTFALLTALRATCTVLLGKTGTISVAAYVGFLAQPEWMATILLITVAIAWYVFEYTRFGYYCKFIGENETACRYAGVPVDKVKIISFMISGMMAGFAGVFISAISGGPTPTSGASFELTVMMAVFLGGVLVTGGMRSKMYKVIIGTITITFLRNGLTILGASSMLNQAIRGVLLIVILCVTTYLNNRANKKAGNKTITTL